MTRKQKVEHIYRAKPELANDDMGLLFYVMNRFGAQLSETQERALRNMGNPEHWTRACREVRAEHPELVNKKTREAREKEFIDYKYNAKPHWETIFKD